MNLPGYLLCHIGHFTQNTNTSGHSNIHAANTKMKYEKYSSFDIDERNKKIESCIMKEPQTVCLYVKTTSMKSSKKSNKILIKVFLKPSTQLTEILELYANPTGAISKKNRKLRQIQIVQSGRRLNIPLFQHFHLSYEMLQFVKFLLGC